MSRDLVTWENAERLRVLEQTLRGEMRPWRFIPDVDDFRVGHVARIKLPPVPRRKKRVKTSDKNAT